MADLKPMIEIKGKKDMEDLFGLGELLGMILFFGGVGLDSAGDSYPSCMPYAYPAIFLGLVFLYLPAAGLATLHYKTCMGFAFWACSFANLLGTCYMCGWLVYNIYLGDSTKSEENVFFLAPVCCVFVMLMFTFMTWGKGHRCGKCLDICLWAAIIILWPTVVPWEYLNYVKRFQDPAVVTDDFLTNLEGVVGICVIVVIICEGMELYHESKHKEGETQEPLLAA